ncbi:MAG: NERD domain-containing protein [Steroidobacteraceae bacterium]
MAVLIPDTPKACTRSERMVFQRFERELPADWIVLHSLGLSGHSHKVWGEADFVVLCPRGVFVIEVKGGRVACKDGKWTVTSLDGAQTYMRNEGPFEQARSAMIAVQKPIEEAGQFRDILFGYGVVMPFERFEATGPEIEPAVLLDSRGFDRNLGFYIGRLATFWEQSLNERRGRAVRQISRPELSVLRQLLRPDVESNFCLASHLTGIERELIELTEQQRRLVRGMRNNPRTLVSGQAGTGKTVLAVDRALDLARGGKRVLLLCFNKLLARHLESGLAVEKGGDRVTVRPIHAFYREVIARAGLLPRLEMAENERELFGRTYPLTFFEAACSTGVEEFDALVVDEAQDLLTRENLEAADVLVKGGLATGSWHLFQDPLQNIYGKDSDTALGWLEDIGFARYELSENCRNTRQIATETGLVSGLDVSVGVAAVGPPVKEVFYSDVTDFHRRLTESVRTLLAGGVGPRDMVILSARRQENSVLAGLDRVANLEITPIDAAGDSKTAIHYSTMHAFKGLERKVVLAIDLVDLGNPKYAQLYYVGLSRARTMLSVFIPEQSRRTYEELAQQFSRRVVG